MNVIRRKMYHCQSGQDIINSCNSETGMYRPFEAVTGCAGGSGFLYLHAGCFLAVLCMQNSDENCVIKFSLKNVRSLYPRKINIL